MSPITYRLILYYMLWTADTKS